MPEPVDVRLWACGLLACVLPRGAAYTVSFDASQQTYQLRPRSGAVNFDLGGHTLDVLDVLFVGFEAGDDGYLGIGNGLLTSGWADVGHHADAGGAGAHDAQRPGRRVDQRHGTSPWDAAPPGGWTCWPAPRRPSAGPSTWATRCPVSPTQPTAR